MGSEIVLGLGLGLEDLSSFNITGKLHIWSRIDITMTCLCNDTHK